MLRLAKEGVIEEESEGRYRVTPLVEVVLSNDRLAELSAWLREQVRAGGAVAEDEAPGDDAVPAGDEAAEDEAAAEDAAADDDAPAGDAVAPEGDRAAEEPVDLGPTLEEAAAAPAAAPADDTTEEVAR